VPLDGVVGGGDGPAVYHRVSHQTMRRELMTDMVVHPCADAQLPFRPYDERDAGYGAPLEPTRAAS